MMDVTERKHTEEQSDRRRSATERSSSTSPRSSIGIAGRRPREVLHQSSGARPVRPHPAGMDLDAGLLAEWHPPDDQAFVYEVDDRSNETKEPYSVDYRFRHADGRWIWVHDEATFLSERDDEGYWQGFLLDITERKHAEDQPARRSLKFRTIVEQNQAIFYTQEIDPQDPTVSLTTYIAPGNTDLIGYTLEEIRADPALWRSIVHPDDRDRVLSADAESNTGDDDRFSMEYRMIAKDGRIVWVQDEASLVRLPDKPPTGRGSCST